MIRNCKNCAGKIRFDIKSQRLLCDSCSSTFHVGEYGTEENVSTEMDCDIYSCSSCGAELVINDTESSMFCPYCGNATVVMSRVAKLKKPEVIIPFEITKEQAAANIKKTFEKRFFVPNVVHPEVMDLRGIYIPYYVTNVEFDGSMYFKPYGKKNNSSPSVRSGYCSANWVTTDASKKLNDTFSQRLEPYYFDSFKIFDEDYLLGFYSDIADVDENEAISKARTRVMEMADEKFKNSVPAYRLGLEQILTTSRFMTEVYDKPVTAMLPAWFYTYKYNGTAYTIAVNGQTGQVSGSVPWNKKKFNILTALLATLITAALFVPFIFVDPLIIMFIIIFEFPAILMLLIFFGRSVGKLGGYRKFTESIRTTNIASSSSLNSFVNKREGGN